MKQLILSLAVLLATPLMVFAQGQGGNPGGGPDPVSKTFFVAVDYVVADSWDDKRDEAETKLNNAIQEWVEVQNAREPNYDVTVSTGQITLHELKYTSTINGVDQYYIMWKKTATVTFEEIPANDPPTTMPGNGALPVNVDETSGTWYPDLEHTFYAEYVTMDKFKDVYATQAEFDNIYDWFVAGSVLATGVKHYDEHIQDDLDDLDDAWMLLNPTKYRRSILQRVEIVSTKTWFYTTDPWTNGNIAPAWGYTVEYKAIYTRQEYDINP